MCDRRKSLGSERSVLAATDVESQIPGALQRFRFDRTAREQMSSCNRQLGLSLLPASPSIFVDPDGVALVMNADSGLVLDPQLRLAPEQDCKSSQQAWG